jgi:hypothetical protein
VLKVNRYLSRNFYLAGQVHSAVGGGAGGTSDRADRRGLEPAGRRQVHVGAEMLAGAAGGGGVDSRGSVVRPMLYAGYQLTPAVALRLGAGRVKALDGPLSSTVVDLAVVISYWGFGRQLRSSRQARPHSFGAASASGDDRFSSRAA